MCVTVWCQIHKYYIQAVVLRKSWPLSQSQWAFVQSQKDNEQNEQNEQNEVKGFSSFSFSSAYVVGMIISVSSACCSNLPLNVSCLHEYFEELHVAASVALFATQATASFMLMCC